MGFSIDFARIKKVKYAFGLKYIKIRRGVKVYGYKGKRLAQALEEKAEA